MTAFIQKETDRLVQEYLTEGGFNLPNYDKQAKKFGNKYLASKIKDKVNLRIQDLGRDFW